MRRIAALAALVSVALSAGCGGNQRRSEVSGYIGHVNAIVADMRAPLKQVAETYGRYRQTGKALESEQPALLRAQRTLETLHRRLAALQPPPDARPLARELDRLTAEQARFARDVLGFAEYVPAFERALAPLAAVNARFRLELVRSHGSRRQIAALRAYRAQLRPIVAQIERLSPPPVLGPLHRRQLASLRQVSRIAQQLAEALARQDSRRLGPLLTAFETASQSTRSVAAQRAEIAAIRAYGRRLRAIDLLAARIERERLALQRRLA